MHIRIMIVDGGITGNLQLGQLLCVYEQFHILHEAKTGRDAVSQCESLKPDIVIINPDVRDMSEASLIRELIRICPLCQCIVLTTSDEPAWSMNVMRAGGRCIVSKPIDATTLHSLISEIYSSLLRYKESLDSE